MKKFLDWLEKYFVPVAGRIGAQRHLVAIRDGFVSIMPLILAGSLAVLLNNTLFQWIPALGFLSGINGNVWWGTFAIMTLLVVFSVGYHLAKGYGVDALAAGLIAVGSFITVTPQAFGDSGWGFLHWGYLNAGGLFTGIIVALISTEIFSQLRRRNIIIKMPDSVPPAVGKAFAAVIPGCAALFFFGIIGFIVTTAGANSLHDIIFNTIQKPLQGFGQNLGSAIVLAVMLNVFWFFGLHGGNIMDPIIQTIYMPAVAANADAVQQGLMAPNIITKAFFDSFVHIGGCGATLALIIAILITTRKRREYREVAKLGVSFGIFNINEPIMFGLPIILNPILLIPFIITPAVLTTVAYIATVTGLVPPTYILTPWITPVGISGFLATGGSIMGGILSVVNFVIAILIYLPFVKLADRMAEKTPEELSGKSSKASLEQSM